VCNIFVIYLSCLCFRSLNHYDHYRSEVRIFHIIPVCPDGLEGFAKERDSHLFTDNLENAHWSRAVDGVDFS
jgi:hypothetical protein